MLHNKMLSILKQMSSGDRAVFEYSGIHMYVENYANIEQLEDYDAMKFFDYMDNYVKKQIISPSWYFGEGNISTTIDVLLSYYDRICFSTKLKGDKYDLGNGFLVNTTTNPRVTEQTLPGSLPLKSFMERNVGFHTLYCLVELDYEKVFKKENIAVDTSDRDKFVNYVRKQRNMIFMHESTVNETLHIIKLTNKVRFPLNSIEEKFFEEIKESAEYAH